MTKAVKLAESTAIEWREKWELSQRSLLEMIETATKEKERANGLQRQVDKLGGLCRALRNAKSAEDPTSATGKSIPLINVFLKLELGSISSQYCWLLTLRSPSIW